MEIWLFWAIAGAISLGVAAILLQALRQGATSQNDGAALQVYRDQLTEVDRDLARAVLTPAEAERVKTEVSRRLLDADRARAKAPLLGGKGSALPAMLAIGLASLAGLITYDRLGVPGYSDLPLSARLAMSEQNYKTRPLQAEAEAAAPPPQKIEVDAQFTDLMTQLRAAVAKRPDDPQGHALLAKNEAVLGDYIAARKAYQHLVEVKGAQASANDHLGLAQTMIIAAGGFVSPEAESQLIATLEKEPTNGLARYFSGLMFAQVGRFDRAFELWEPLLREGPADAPWLEPIRAGLQDVADRAGIKYQLPDVKGPNADDVANAATMTPAERQDMIKGMVGGLESRLMTDGGPLEDWLKLMNALSVLGDKPRAKAAYDAAAQRFASDTAAMAKIESAASDAGITP